MESLRTCELRNCHRLAGSGYVDSGLFLKQFHCFSAKGTLRSWNTLRLACPPPYPPTPPATLLPPKPPASILKIWILPLQLTYLSSVCSSLHKRQSGWNFRWHRETNLFFIFVFGCTGSLLLTWAFSSRGEWGLLFLAVHGLLSAVAPLVDHRLWAWGL